MAHRPGTRWLRATIVIVALVPVAVVALPDRLTGDIPASGAVTSPSTAAPVPAVSPPVPPPSPVSSLPPPPSGSLDPGPPPRSSLTPEVWEFDILATGDLLIHSPIFRRALAHGGGDGYDFRPFFANIRPIVRRAALAICHVETPLSPGPPASYPVFSTPTELAEAIAWTGWDVCSTASNHSLDRGQEGIDSTAEALDGAGVAHTGSFRSEAEARRAAIFTARGVQIALLSYSEWTNGFPLPSPWSVNLISVPKIEQDAARARRRGADLVIANFHWGTEYHHEPDARQEAVATDLLGRGVVDAILGQHAHVVQPIRRVAGRFVVFGEGNLISSQSGESQDGLMAVLRVRADRMGARIVAVDYVPIWVSRPDYVVEPVGRALRRLTALGEGDGWLAAALRASYLRTVAVVGSGPRTRPLPATVP